LTDELALLTPDTVLDSEADWFKTNSN
jgi:hypothetical protein